MGFSLLSVAMDTSFKYKLSCKTQEDTAIIDSLQYLRFNNNYVKPWPVEHRLVKLLTQAF